MTDGKHYGGFKFRNHPGINSIWITVITAVAGTIIKDLSNESSMLKRILGKILPKQIKNKHDVKVINAEYEVINDDTEKSLR